MVREEVLDLRLREKSFLIFFSRDDSLAVFVRWDFDSKYGSATMRLLTRPPMHSAGACDVQLLFWLLRQYASLRPTQWGITGLRQKNCIVLYCVVLYTALLFMKLYLRRWRCGWLDASVADHGSEVEDEQPIGLSSWTVDWWQVLWLQVIQPHIHHTAPHSTFNLLTYILFVLCSFKYIHTICDCL